MYARPEDHQSKKINGSGGSVDVQCKKKHVIITYIFLYSILFFNKNLSCDDVTRSNF